MNHKQERRNDEGMALLLAMFFISITLLLLGGLAARTTNSGRHTDYYSSYENCMFGVETGLAQMLASVETGGATVGLTNEPAVVTGEDFMAFDFDDPLVAAVTVPGMTNLSYFAYAHNWGNDGFDNNGDGAIDDTQEQWVYSVFSAARDDSIVRRAEIIIAGQDANVWRNAIFAGSGQSGGLINGHVDIHGSVHLLGDNLLPGAEALSLGGNSSVGNNYSGMPSDLSNRVPPLPTRVFNGETVGTLNAKLRVRKGLVGLSGSAEIGQGDDSGNTVKETMDGVYVTDGFMGGPVYSDNGTGAAYDLASRVQMPFVQDDWRSPVTGERAWDSSRSEWYTHEHYFDEVLVGDPANPTDGIYNGNMAIKANQNFYYNASRPSDTNPAHRIATDDYIYFDANTNKMEINGQISVNGNFSLARGNGNDKTINYTGRAAILVHGSVSLDTNLLSVNQNGTIANSYPAANCFGIMATGNLSMGANSQLTLMGGFYAQGKIVSSKQTTVGGTFVSNFFDMGNQVPSIYQVPSLADNLPFGMIGAYPVLVMTKISWRELGI